MIHQTDLSDLKLTIGGVTIGLSSLLAFLFGLWKTVLSPWMQALNTRRETELETAKVQAGMVANLRSMHDAYQDAMKATTGQVKASGELVESAKAMTKQAQALLLHAVAATGQVPERIAHEDHDVAGVDGSVRGVRGPAGHQIQDRR